MTEKTSGDVYVYSTLAADMLYTLYKDSPNGQKIPVKEIRIRGGAGVADRRTLITPLGLVTPISAEDLAMLWQNDVFVLHESNGFISVQATKKDVEAVVPEMNHRDASAPTIAEDFGDPEDENDTDAKVSKSNRDGKKSGKGK